MSRIGIFGGLFGGGMGCLILFVAIMLGPWCLQYDLNFWVPILAKKGIVNNIAPVQMSLLLFIVGIILSEVAIPVAVITLLVSGLGLVG